MTAQMSDSKGAAIEELKQILKHYYLYMKNCEIAGDSKISHTAVKGAINAANEFNEETVEAILALLAQEVKRKVLEGRLVELDLFEQFLNQRENTGITRGDLWEFKHDRLEDLTKRLERLG